MQSVELKTAFHWHCECCGHANFALPQKAELTEADAEFAYRQYHELDQWAELPEGWRQFELIQIPNTVTCEKCLNSYTTIDESTA